MSKRIKIVSVELTNDHVRFVERFIGFPTKSHLIGAVALQHKEVKDAYDKLVDEKGPNYSDPPAFITMFDDYYGLVNAVTDKNLEDARTQSVVHLKVAGVVVGQLMMSETFGVQFEPDPRAGDPL